MAVSISSAVLTGSTLVIAGTGLGAKPTAAPVFYQPFITTADGATYSAAGWDFLGGNIGGNPGYDTYTHVDMSEGVGGGSWYTMLDGGGDVFTHFGKFMPAASDTVVCSFFHKMHPLTAGSNANGSGQIKGCRVGPTGGNTGVQQGGDMYAYHYAQFGASHYSATFTDVNDTGGFDPVGHWWANGGAENNVNATGSGIPMLNSAWHFKETIHKLNTLTSANGIMYNHTDGITHINVSNLQVKYGAGEYLEYCQPTPGYTNGFLGNPINVYHSHMYIDNTMARAFLGNASTLAACTARFMVNPTAWTTTAITATVDNIPAGYNWLYVSDTTNTINSSGYSYSTSSGGNYTLSITTSVLSTSSPNIRLVANRKLVIDNNSLTLTNNDIGLRVARRLLISKSSLNTSSPVIGLSTTSGSTVTPPHTFSEWILLQPGLSGTVQDRLKQYLISLGYSGHTQDMLYSWLTGLGYPQTHIQEKYAAWALSNLIH